MAKPKTNGMDTDIEKKSSDITTGFVGRLIELFEKLRKLAGKVPSKDPELWERCLNEAEGELRKEAEAQAKIIAEQEDAMSGFESHPVFSEPTVPEKIRVSKMDVIRGAHEKYWQADPKYVERCRRVEQLIAGRAAKIWLALLSTLGKKLLGDDRAKDTLLAEDWKEIHRDRAVSLRIMEFQNDGRIQDTINVLGVIKDDTNSSRELSDSPQEEPAAVSKEPPKKTPGSNISGMLLAEAIPKAEKHVSKHGFPGISRLAELVGCSKGTLYKAIKSSTELQRAKQQHKKKTSPPTKGLSEAIMDTQESPEPPPDEEADIELLLQEKSHSDLIDGILKHTRIIDKAEQTKNADWKPQDEEKLRSELEKCQDAQLAQLYISRQAAAADVHADDPTKPGHRREA